jgi:hypothetical protein
MRSTLAMRVIPAAVATAVGLSLLSVGCRRGAPQERTSPPPAGDAAAARPTEPPNALTLPVASVEAVVNPEKLPAYSGPTGSVEGTIYVKGPEAPDVPGVDTHACAAAMDTYGKLFRAGAPGKDGARPLADAIVGVTGYAGYFLADTSPSVHVTITASCAYPTTTIAMTFGQRLEIDNSSKIIFAPRLEGMTQPAVMIAPPEQNGGPVKIYPPRASRYSLVDNIQPFVRGNVYVLRQPLHAVSDVRGHYRIDGVPVGKMKVSALLPAIDAGADASIEVRANVVESQDLTITYAPQDAGAATGPRQPSIP